MGWQHDRDRGNRHARGYGYQWTVTRKIVLKRDNWLCVPCQSQGRTTVATAVDHITPKFKGGTDSLDNLQSICTDCHVRKSIDETRNKAGKACSIDGVPIDSAHHWNR